MIVAQSAKDQTGSGSLTCAAGECSRARWNGKSNSWLKALELYRFPLALAVVAVHSGEYILSQAAKSSQAELSGLGLWLVAFLTLVSRLATPTFLVIAGFLFFRDGPVSIAQYRRKLQSRLQTLVMPYFAWNLLAILLLCAPGAGKYYFLATGNVADASLSLPSLVKWCVGWPIYPADAPFWFVRDLVLLVLLAPLFNLLPKRGLVLGISLLGLYWVLGPPDLIPGGIPRSFSLFFFSIGAWMGINRVRPKDGPATNRLMVTAGIVFLVSAVVGATLGTHGLYRSGAVVFLENLVRLSGVMLVLCNTAKTPLANPFSRLLRWLSPASFFLFAMHYCVLICFFRVISHLPSMPSGTGYRFLMFCILWAGAVAISLGFYFLLKRLAPTLLAVLDGNRSSRERLARPGMETPGEAAGARPEDLRPPERHSAGPRFRFPAQRVPSLD